MTPTNISLAVCAALFFGCHAEPPHLVVTDELGPGIRTETAEFRRGAAAVASRVVHYYNAPTQQRDEAGDFKEVFRAMTGKELAEPAAVRSIPALLAALEKEGMKLTEETAAKAETSAMSPTVRRFTVSR